jgi:hypothetical protein
MQRAFECARRQRVGQGQDVVHWLRRGKGMGRGGKGGRGGLFDANKIFDLLSRSTVSTLMTGSANGP